MLKYQRLLLPVLVCAGVWRPASLFSEPVAERFTPPHGFVRVQTGAQSFGNWLRDLPLLPEGAQVILYDGRPKARQDVHAAVLDVSVGERDLQQCADAIIRLRAEFLRATDREDEIAFNFTSGDRCAWRDWKRGKRPVVNGNRVTWTTVKADSGQRSFEDYLRSVFTYAGSASLAKELSTAFPLNVMPGDVFIQGGFPGHAVMVLDVIENADGARKMMLAQSFMPAQSIHILKNPSDASSVWYDVLETGVLITPEWKFRYEDLKRFP